MIGLLNVSGEGVVKNRGHRMRRSRLAGLPGRGVASLNAWCNRQFAFGLRCCNEKGVRVSRGKDQVETVSVV